MSGIEHKAEQGASAPEESLSFYSRSGQQLVQRSKERFIQKIEEAIAASPEDTTLKELLVEQRAELEAIKNAPVEVDITHFKTIEERERAVSDVRNQIYELSTQEQTPAVQAMTVSAQRLAETYARMPLRRDDE